MTRAQFSALSPYEAAAVLYKLAEAHGEVLAIIERLQAMRQEAADRAIAALLVDLEEVAS